MAAASRTERHFAAAYCVRPLTILAFTTRLSNCLHVGWRGHESTSTAQQEAEDGCFTTRTASHLHRQRTPWSVFQDGRLVVPMHQNTLAPQRRHVERPPHNGKETVRNETLHSYPLQKQRVVQHQRFAASAPDKHLGTSTPQANIPPTSGRGSAYEGRLVRGPDLMIPPKGLRRLPYVDALRSETRQPIHLTTASGTLSSPCRVLCTLRSIYFCAIGLVPVFSLSRDTPCISSFNPKKLYSRVHTLCDYRAEVGA